MYNLSVQLVASYFVGDGQWLVHNVTLDAKREWLNNRGEWRIPQNNEYTKWRYTSPDSITASGRLPDWFDSWYVDKAGRRMPNIGGNLPVNWQWAGRNISASWKGLQNEAKLRAYARLGVDFDLYGFPIFDQYSLGSVSVNATDIWKNDFAMANYQFIVEGGLETFDYMEKTGGDPTFWHQKVGYHDYTWHHLQDTETMLLIPQYLNDEVWHTGGGKICTLKP